MNTTKDQHRGFLRVLFIVLIAGIAGCLYFSVGFNLAPSHPGFVVLLSPAALAFGAYWGSRLDAWLVEYAKREGLRSQKHSGGKTYIEGDMGNMRFWCMLALALLTALLCWGVCTLVAATAAYYSFGAYRAWAGWFGLWAGMPGLGIGWLLFDRFIFGWLDSRRIDMANTKHPDQRT